MSKRVSRSLIDPWLMPKIKLLYERLHIPASFPPEGIIGIGHIAAMLGAVGFAYATTTWWGGLLAAIGVAVNHTADCMDGTHARSTDQCRNGGELLDHFADPLSFSYYLWGISAGVGQPHMGVAAVICLYATAVLTNIKAKMIGEFTLATFGPTEFKSLLVILGVFLTLLNLIRQSDFAGLTAYRFFVILLVVGVFQLIRNLYKAVCEVNAAGAAPDTTEWETRS